jgi:urease accessory protein
MRVRLHVAGIALTAVFAACHGIAHGIELPATALALPFAMGFASATALLHLTGFAAGRLFGLTGRWAGMPIAIAGSWLLVGALG